MMKIKYKFVEFNYRVIRFLFKRLLRKNHILLKFTYVPKELYQKPLIMDLSKIFKKISNNKIDIKCLIAFIVAKQDCRGDANFYNYKSKFKDSWFSVYFVKDDVKGRKFMLNKGSINIESVIKIPMLDQKLIVTSLKKDIDFKVKVNEIKFGKLIDAQGREWFKIVGRFNTVSAFPDENARNLSIKLYLSSPKKLLYKELNPFHQVELVGTLLIRKYNGYWVLVAFNGSRFITKSGKVIDTFKQTNLKKLYYRMLDELIIKII